jgi:hypothetical protein
MSNRSASMWSKENFMAAALALGLALFAVQGLHTRFHADDFCMAAAVNQHGFFGAQANWYLTWSGRYAYFLVTSLLAAIGPGFAPYTAMLVMAAWWGGLALLFRRWRLPAVTLLLPPLVLFAVLATLPNRFQSLYWQNGMVNYTLPLVLLTLGAAWIAAQAGTDRRPGWAMLGLNAAAALAVGGFSETALAVQITLLVLGLGVTFLPGWRTPPALRPLLLAWLAGSLLALVVVFAAPGNQVRQAAVGSEMPGLARIVLFSMRNAAHITGKYILWHPLTAAAALLLPLALGWMHPSPQAGRFSLSAVREAQVQRLVLLPLAGFALVTAACAPTVYAMNAYPDDRVIVVPQYLLVLSVVLWGFLAGRTLAAFLPAGAARLRPAVVGLAVLVTMAAVGLVAVDTLAALPAARQYAAGWDERDRSIREQRAGGASTIQAAPLDSRAGLMELSESPQEWVNQCMAGYYGVEAVEGKIQKKP